MNELDVLTRMCPSADSFDPNLKAQLRASLFGVVAERDDTSSDDFVAELIHATSSGESSGLAKAGRSGRPRRRWPVLAAAAILAVAMVAGLVGLSLRPTPTDRLVTSVGFDGNQSQ